MTSDTENIPPAAASWRGAQFGDWLVVASIGVGLVFWWISLPLMDPDKLDDLGLVGIVPWQFWVAICTLTAGFSLSLSASKRAHTLRLVALVTLVILLHATPPIVYGTLRYSWAWKHIGIVDYIQRYDEVNRAIPFLAAYHNWPGFFWISAKVADLFSLDPLQISNWVRFFPVFSNIVFLVLLGSIFNRFTNDSRLVHAALWIFVCANWVGQDYFSPQAFAFSLHLLVLALCLGPLMQANLPGTTVWSQRLFQARERFARALMPASSLPAWQKILAVCVLFAALFGIVAAHQLTPLILVFSLFSLSVVTPLSLGYPTLAAFTLVFWVIYPAAPFTASYLPGEVAQLGQTIEGVTGKLVNTASVDREVAVVVWAGRALSAGVVLLAALGWFRRLRLGERDGIICVLAVAPLPILGVTSYGGEAVFRIYLFCLPFIAFFAAAAFFPSKEKTAGGVTLVSFALAAVLMSIGFLYANNGKDRQYRFSQNEVEAAFWLYSRSGPGTLLVEGARSYPSQFMNYENFTYLPIANERALDRAEILENPAEVLSRWFADPDWNDGYVILTKSQQAYVEALGIMPDGALEALALELAASPDFLLVFANEDARIFTARRFLQ